MVLITGDVKVLFVRVSVVSLPTNVSVEVGSVKVPVLTMVLITGDVKVLLVRACIPLKVTTVLSIDIVPVEVIVPPVSPVPAVIELTELGSDSLTQLDPLYLRT